MRQEEKEEMSVGLGKTGREDGGRAETLCSVSKAQDL